MAAPTILAGLSESVSVNGLDLHTLGYNVTEITGLHMAPIRTADEVFQNKHGAKAWGDQFDIRPITLRGMVFGNSASDLIDRIADLKGFFQSFQGISGIWKATGGVWLERVDVASRHWLVLYDGTFDVGPIGPWRLSKYASLEVSLRAVSPFAEGNDIEEESYTGTAGTFKALALGSAPSEPIYALVGAATTPELIVGDKVFHCDFDGDLVANVLSGTVTGAYPNIGPLTFTGAGLDDMTTGGTFTGAIETNYKVQPDQIDAVQTVDTIVQPTGALNNGTYLEVATTKVGGGGDDTFEAQVNIGGGIITSVYVHGIGGNGYAINDTITLSGLNDAGGGGNDDGTVDVASIVDTFKWSDDGGSTWDGQRVEMTGSAQTLNNGVTVTFAATIGHTATDYWTFNTYNLAVLFEPGVYGMQFYPDESATVNFNASPGVIGNKTEGAWLWIGRPQWAYFGAGSDRVFFQNYEDATNYVGLKYVAASDYFLFEKTIGGVTKDAQSAVQTFASNDLVAVVGSYGPSGVQIWVNGVLGTEDTDTAALTNNLEYLKLHTSADGSQPDVKYDYLVGWSRELTEEEAFKYSSNPELISSENVEVAYSASLTAGEVLMLDAEKFLASKLSGTAKTNALGSISGTIPQLHPSKSVVYNSAAIGTIKIAYRKRWL